MSEPDAIAKLRHDLANPLAALLTEAPMVLLSQPPPDPEVHRAITEIEKAAIRMRGILRGMAQS